MLRSCLEIQTVPDISRYTRVFSPVLLHKVYIWPMVKRFPGVYKGVQTRDVRYQHKYVTISLECSVFLNNFILNGRINVVCRRNLLGASSGRYSRCSARHTRRLCEERRGNVTQHSLSRTGAGQKNDPQYLDGGSQFCMCHDGGGHMYDGGLP